MLSKGEVFMTESVSSLFSAPQTPELQLQAAKNETALLEEEERDFTYTIRYRTTLARINAYLCCPPTTFSMPLICLLCAPCLCWYCCTDRENCSKTPLKILGCSDRPPETRLEFFCVFFKPCWLSPPPDLLDAHGQDYYLLPEERRKADARAYRLNLLRNQIDSLNTPQREESTSYRKSVSTEKLTILLSTPDGEVFKYQAPQTVEMV